MTWLPYPEVVLAHAFDSRRRTNAHYVCCFDRRIYPDGMRSRYHKLDGFGHLEFDII